MIRKISLEAIAERLRSFLLHQSAGSDVDPGWCLGIDDGSLDSFLHRRQPVDVYLLVDLVASVVDHFGVDAQWLLTGDYSLTAHRMLEEDGPPARDRLRVALEGRLTGDGGVSGRESWKSLGA